MSGISSTALRESQATLNCGFQASLYRLRMTLGQRIKTARRRLRPRVTQKQLADALSISDKAVSAWERDETEPTRDKLPELRFQLRVTYSWLLEGWGEPPAPDSIEVAFDDRLRKIPKSSEVA